MPSAADFDRGFMLPRPTPRWSSNQWNFGNRTAMGLQCRCHWIAGDIPASAFDFGHIVSGAKSGVESRTRFALTSQRTIQSKDRIRAVRFSQGRRQKRAMVRRVSGQQFDMEAQLPTPVHRGRSSAWPDSNTSSPVPNDK
ncbi:hypothetical protein Pla52nx_001359 [Stieleria varia]|uniref:hypothetical protein n=1 Tax=Stieleria varia TaxID=2528005 RepID=UPI0011B7B921